MTPGNALLLLHRALGGCIDTGLLLSDVGTILKKMAISKFLPDGFGKKGRGGGPSCPWISFDS